MSGHGHAKNGASKQDVAVMAITFFVGMAAGFYLYTTAFAPKFDEFTGQTEEIYEDFVIEGARYGGGRGGSNASFQVLSDGSFRYLPDTEISVNSEIKEGVVPRATIREIKAALTQLDLEKAAQIVTRGDCASYVDGLDYSYNVTMAGESYILDTCTTNLRFESTTYLALDKLWKYFETTN